MRLHLFLAVTLGAMTCLLLASRCTDDQDRKAESATAAEEPLPTGVPGTEPGKGNGGMESSPEDGLGEVATPLDDANERPPQSGDALQDDQSFEPQPVPEATKGL
jgi:hypothetical protein